MSLYALDLHIQWRDLDDILEIICTGSVGVQRMVMFHFWPKVKKLGRFKLRLFSATKALHVLEILIHSCDINNLFIKYRCETKDYFFAARKFRHNVGKAKKKRLLGFWIINTLKGSKIHRSWASGSFCGFYNGLSMCETIKKNTSMFFIAF